MARNRKALFLASTILRMAQPRKAPDEGGATPTPTPAPVADDIEVGPGFAEAADRMGGDDNRQKPAEAEVTEEGDENAETLGDEGGDDADEKGDERGTAKYIRELKRQRREDRRVIDELKALVENKGSTTTPPAVTHTPTSEPAPDPSDEKKYPLGVIDDGYIEAKIEWTAKQIVAKTLDGERQTARAQAQQANDEARMAGLRTKFTEMSDKGSDLYDDFDKIVVEAGLKGSLPITEMMFTAASEAAHGEKILYEMAKDIPETRRVAAMSPYQQMKYVQEKDADLVAKHKPRTKPGASEPPSDPPRGRNSSHPIRDDTDNLNDFRKKWYSNER